MTGEALAISTRRGSRPMRDLILEATFRVVAARTISGTRIPAIATEAEVSQGIIHYHFETKDKLLLSLLDWLLEAFRDFRGVTSGRRLTVPAQPEPEAARRAYLDYVRMVIETDRDMARVFYDFWVQAVSGPGAFQDAIRVQFDQYRRGVKAMVAAPAVNGGAVDVMTGVIVSLLEGAILQLSLEDQPFDREAYLEAVDRIIVEALPTLCRERNA